MGRKLETARRMQPSNVFFNPTAVRVSYAKLFHARYYIYNRQNSSTQASSVCCFSLFSLKTLHSPCPFRRPKHSSCRGGLGCSCCTLLRLHDDGRPAAKYRLHSTCLQLRAPGCTYWNRIHLVKRTRTMGKIYKIFFGGGGVI